MEMVGFKDKFRNTLSSRLVMLVTPPQYPQRVAWFWGTHLAVMRAWMVLHRTRARKCLVVNLYAQCFWLLCACFRQERIMMPSYHKLCNVMRFAWSASLGSAAVISACAWWKALQPQREHQKYANWRTPVLTILCGLQLTGVCCRCGQ
eukprot:3982913-Amphidinium_carterae.1